MAEKFSSSPPLPTLLWRHFNWHLWVGLAVWTCCAGPFIFYHYWQERTQILQESFYADHLGEELNDVATEYATYFILLFIGAVSIAIIGSCIRYPLLAALCRKARTRTNLVVNSLLVFMLQVTVLSIPPWPIAYNRFSIESISHQFLILFLMSLPWLVATGLASRRLAVVLGLPLTTPTSASAPSG